MPDTMTAPATASPVRTLSLDADELVLLVTALRLLRSTLGREEAEELAEVQRLLDRIAPRDR